MTLRKDCHELHVKIPERFKEVLFTCSQISKTKTVSEYVRKALLEQCRKTLNGSTLLESILQDIDFIEEEIQKEKKS